MRLFLLTVFPLCLLLSSCFSSNSKLKQDEQLKQSNNSSSIVSNPIPQPITLSSGGNLTINNPIFYDTEKTLQIRSNSEIQLSQQYSFFQKVFNPWTFILFAIGILMILYIIKIIKTAIMNSSIGGGLRVFNSLFEDISDIRKNNLDPNKEETLKQLELSLTKKYNKLLRK